MAVHLQGIVYDRFFFVVLLHHLFYEVIGSSLHPAFFGVYQNRNFILVGALAGCVETRFDALPFFFFFGGKGFFLGEFLEDGKTPKSCRFKYHNRNTFVAMEITKIDGFHCFFESSFDRGFVFFTFYGIVEYRAYSFLMHLLDYGKAVLFGDTSAELLKDGALDESFDGQA